MTFAEQAKKNFSVILCVLCGYSNSNNGKFSTEPFRPRFCFFVSQSRCLLGRICELAKETRIPNRPESTDLAWRPKHEDCSFDEPLASSRSDLLLAWA